MLLRGPIPPGGAERYATTRLGGQPLISSILLALENTVRKARKEIATLERMSPNALRYYTARGASPLEQKKLDNIGPAVIC